MSSPTRAGPSRSFTMRVPTALYDALVKAADENGITISAYLKYLAAQQIRKDSKQARAA